MKKVTSKETFEFLISGIKGTSSENSVTVGPKGVVVDDEAARMLKDRFGANVEITNADAKAVKKAAEDALNDADEETTDPEGKEPSTEEEAKKSK